VVAGDWRLEAASGAAKRSPAEARSEQEDANFILYERNENARIGRIKVNNWSRVVRCKVYALCAT